MKVLFCTGMVNKKWVWILLKKDFSDLSNWAYQTCPLGAGFDLAKRTRQPPVWIHESNPFSEVFFPLCRCYSPQLIPRMGTCGAATRNSPSDRQISAAARSSWVLLIPNTPINLRDVGTQTAGYTNVLVVEAFLPCAPHLL